MGISKLSEKCLKCDRKDDCDDKRMEACAYIIAPLATGGIVNNNSIFIHQSNGIEIMGSFSGNGLKEHNREIIESIRKALKNSIEGCAFKVGEP